MKIFIFSLLVCFALEASASEVEEDVKIEHDLNSNGNYSTGTTYLAKVMSRVRRGQYPGSGITPGKSSKFWLNRCSPCWFAAENMLKKKPAKTNNEDNDLDDVMDENEAVITATGERKFSSAHCAKLMSRVKPGQLPDSSGIAPGKSPKFWLKKCQPCWYAAKKLQRSKPGKPTSTDADFDSEDDDVLDMDDLEEDEIKQDPIRYYRRRGGFYGGFYGLPYYGGFYGWGYPGYLFG